MEMISKNKPKLSIIIPTTREKYLYRCLNSISTQSLTDIQIIIINDKPNNESLEKEIRKLSELFNFIYIKNIKNLGVSCCRNIGIDNAKGEYLYFFDDDDYLYENNPDSLAEICNILDNDKTDLCVFRLDRLPFQIFEDRFKNIKTISYLDFIGNFGVYTSRPIGNKIFRTEYFKKNNIRFKEGFVAEEDHLLLAQLPYLNPKISLYNKNVFIYYQNNDIERITSTSKYKDDFKIVLNEILDRLEKSSLSEDVKSRIKNCITKRRK